jgi:hypothetical protein
VMRTPQASGQSCGHTALTTLFMLIRLYEDFEGGPAILGEGGLSTTVTIVSGSG